MFVNEQRTHHPVGVTLPGVTRRAPSHSLLARGWVDDYVTVMDTNPRALDADALLDLASQVNREKARLDARLCDTAVVFALRNALVAPRSQPGGEMRRRYGGPGTPECAEFSTTQLAVELRCSDEAADDYLAVGLDLDYRLPCTHSEFRAGRISYGHVKVICETTRDLDEDSAVTLDERLCEAAESRTPARLRVYARRQVARLHPKVSERQAAEAFEKREVRVFDAGNAMGILWLTAPLDTLLQIDRQLTTAAKTLCDPHDTRTFDQRRCDIAIDLLLNGPSAAKTTGGDVPQPSPVYDRLHTQVNLTMTAETLLGMDDQSAMLDGYGPITADQARRLALESASATLRRLFTDPVDGAVMVYDANRYVFTPEQVKAIRALHPRYIFPGCRVRAEQCDIDHRVEYVSNRDGRDPPGQTVVANGQPLCRRHHRLKTHGDWTVVQTGPHRYQWSGPTGRTCTVDDTDEQPA
jgi:hypothetical protein